MFCPKCGAQNEDNVYHCASCGAPVREDAGVAGQPPPPPPGQQGAQPPATGQGGYAPPKPNNWLIPAILTTVLCGCLPLGIIAIVFAAQVDGKYSSGDYAGAEAAAGKAKTFTLLSFGLALVCGGGYFVLVLVGALSGAAGPGF